MRLDHPQAGTSLIELIGSLLILELAGLLALTAALAVGRGQRHASLVTATDLARLDSVAAVRADPSCQQAPAATIRTVVLPATAERRRLSVQIRCGR